MNAAPADNLIDTLAERFSKNTSRHADVQWADVQKRLEAKPEKMQVLEAMEKTGGEPDVIGVDKKSGEFVFCDCSAESPSGRRSLCYDRSALDSRKENKPVGDVVRTAESMGIELLTEEAYRELQTLGVFDRTTSSWVQTPDGIRILGGAIFCDRRYNHVFTYHNGADSYYSSRGFRGTLGV